MLTLTEQEKINRKAEYAREYERKHNYMAIPGDTDMPEYSTEEIHDIENGMLLKDIAEKYGRSFAGVSSKKVRMSTKYLSPNDKKKKEYRRILGLKAEGRWDFSNQCEIPKKATVTVTKIKVRTINKDVDGVLNGSLSIDDFLNI